MLLNLVFCVVFLNIVVGFFVIFLAIAFSVLRFTASDYSFGFFKFVLADGGYLGIFKLFLADGSYLGIFKLFLADGDHLQ